jgi:hypothetical protein
MVTVRYKESDQSSLLKAPISGRPVDTIQFKEIKNIINTNAGYYKKGDPLPEGLQMRFDKGFYQYNDKGFLVKTSSGQLIKKVIQKTVDPIKVFTDYKKLSLSYKYKKQVEETLNAAKEITFNAKIVQTTTDGRVIKKFGQDFLAKGDSLVYSRLKDTVDKYLFDKTKEPFSGNTGEPGERQFSFQQTVETLNNYVRTRALGLNIASGITNFAMGTISNFQYAGRGEFFDEKELKKAYWILKDSVGSLATVNKWQSGNATKVALLMRKMNLMGSFQEDFMGDDKDFKKLYEVLFSFQKGGEFVNQGAVMISMMLRDKVKDASGKEVSLFDAFTVKDGKLTIDDQFNFGEEDFRRLGSAIAQVNKEVHGDYDPLNMMTIKKKQVGRILMMLRTWMPMSIKQRMGTLYKDQILSDYLGKEVWREGRWRTLGRSITGQGVAGGAANLFRFTTAAMLSTVSNTWGRKMIDAMGISEQDKANMYSNMKEMWWLVTIATLGSFLKVAWNDGNDDDEEETVMNEEGEMVTRKKRKSSSDKADDANKSFLSWLANQSQRVENDLWFFYSPLSAYKVVKDPVAMGDVLNRGIKVINAGKNFIFDNENDTYKTGFRKGNSKFATELRLFTPVIKQGESLWGMIQKPYDNEIR